MHWADITSNDIHKCSTSLSPVILIKRKNTGHTVVYTLVQWQPNFVRKYARYLHKQIPQSCIAGFSNGQDMKRFRQHTFWKHCASLYSSFTLLLINILLKRQIVYAQSTHFSIPTRVPTHLTFQIFMSVKETRGSTTLTWST